jgi:ABC-2 type transport system permease protein
MTIFRFALKRSFRSPLNLLLLCVLPVGIVFLPSAEGWTLPIGFHFYGLVILFAAMLMTRPLMEDRLSGVLRRIAAAPISHVGYLWESLLAYALVLVVQNALVMGLGVLVHGARLASPLTLFLAYSLFSFTAIAISLAFYSLIHSREAAYSTLSTFIMIISMIGGFYWPLSIMPPLLQRLAMVTPSYWLMNAMGIIQAGGNRSQFALSLAIMALFTAVFLLLGSRRKMA